MGDCEKDFDYKPQPEEEEEEEQVQEEQVVEKKEQLKSTSSSHATNVETLVGDLQNLSLKGNETNRIDDKPDASDQDPATTTIETLEGEGEELQNLITSKGSGEILQGDFQNLITSEVIGNHNDKPVASDHDCPSTTTTTTETTSLLDGDLQNLSSEGKENQRDKPDASDNDPTTFKTLDGDLHNFSSEWNGNQKDNGSTTITTLDGQLHNLSSEWDGTQNDKLEEVETNLSSEWDGTQNDKLEEVETIFKEEKRRIFQYPLRPDEPDCVFYLRTGSCRYGFHCKFNHPPRKKHQVKGSSYSGESSVQIVEPIPAIQIVKEKEKEREDYTEWTGKIECKYYRTPGGCKFVKACRYYHPREKNVVAPPTEFNFLGLPMRPGEKKCPFFMRTGSCKFATSCRFHHPDPTDAVESDPLSGYYDAESVELHSEGSPQPHATSWSPPGTYNETAPYMDTSSQYPTGMVSPSRVHQNQEWNGYQVPVRYPPEGNRNPQSASVMNHSTRKANNSMHQQQQMVVDEFPERPGQQECQYYMKHGDCKYRSACRFHHPKNCSTNSPVLSSIGLPLRPDQMICSNYSRFGICKYGPACKYDHPA